MAFRHGRFAEVTVGGTALSVYCDTLDLNIDVDTSDTTTFTKSWKTAIAGLAGGTLDMSGSYDPLVTNGPSAKLTSLIQAAPFAVVVEPGGNLSGQQRRSFNAVLANYKESSPVADKVTFSATLMITDTVTFAQI
jgi:hypothetical protein